MPDSPADRLYDAAGYLWFKPEGEGVFRVGITADGIKTVGILVACMPKRLDGRVEANRSLATIESGKWVGAVRSPFAGDVVESNEELIDHPETVNRDPFGQGWLVAIKADDPDMVKEAVAASNPL
ncbi:MAG: glycine cleavage system protein H [Rhodospirillales bacterium]|nr:MAG: glycine cleavage system protein H [Rhodospirillales bacterium]